MSESGGQRLVEKGAPAWELAQLLSEPHRREVYRLVRQAGRPLTRDEVAGATGINRRLATFHLDRLARAGFLVTDFARPEGRSGPGAGRPAKRYAASDLEVEVSVPTRHYVFAARLLAQAVSDRPADAVNAAYDVAHAEGRRIGEARKPPAGRLAARRTRAVVIEALDDLGYEPVDDGSRSVRLRNCPFRAVADIAPGLVCGMNRELVAGVLQGVGVTGGEAQPGGRAPDCCVIVVIPK